MTRDPEKLSSAGATPTSNTDGDEKIDPVTTDTLRIEPSLTNKQLLRKLRIQVRCRAHTVSSFRPAQRATSWYGA